jgi:hypothetical protein
MIYFPVGIVKCGGLDDPSWVRSKLLLISLLYPLHERPQDRWWHATINLDPYTAFLSTFTTEHGVVVDDEL